MSEGKGKEQAAKTDLGIPSGEAVEDPEIWDPLHLRSLQKIVWGGTTNPLTEQEPIGLECWPESGLQSLTGKGFGIW